MKNQTWKSYFPIVLLFIILNALIVVFGSFLDSRGFDREFLTWANLFLFVVSIGGFLFQQRALQSPNPQAFVRGMYASMIFKMFLVMVVVLVYVFLFKNKLNKPGLFTAMGLYIVYTALEVKALMKIARKKKDA